MPQKYFTPTLDKEPQKAPAEPAGAFPGIIKELFL